MDKNCMEKIINSNSVQIGKNTTNISLMIKFMFLVLAGIIGQLIHTIFKG